MKIHELRVIVLLSLFTFSGVSLAAEKDVAAIIYLKVTPEQLEYSLRAACNDLRLFYDRCRLRPRWKKT